MLHLCRYSTQHAATNEEIRAHPSLPSQSSRVPTATAPERSAAERRYPAGTAVRRRATIDHTAVASTSDPIVMSTKTDTAPRVVRSPGEP